MAAMNRRVVLAARPHGEPTPAHFRLEESRVPVPKAGEVLLRTRWLSLDPYMRGRMSAAKSYAAPVAIGEAMTGGTVGRDPAATTTRSAVTVSPAPPAVGVIESSRSPVNAACPW